MPSRLGGCIGWGREGGVFCGCWVDERNRFITRAAYSYVCGMQCTANVSKVSQVRIQGEADQPRGMCSDLYEFNRNPKQTVTPILRPQRIRKNYFPLRESPKMTLLRGWESGLENFHL